MYVSISYFLLQSDLLSTHLIFQIHPSPSDVNQLSLSFACLLCDNYVCHNLWTTYQDVARLHRYQPMQGADDRYISSD